LLNQPTTVEPRNELSEDPNERTSTEEGLPQVPILPTIEQENSPEERGLVQHPNRDTEPKRNQESAPKTVARVLCPLQLTDIGPGILV
jgi:hypothetical protein